MTIDIPDDVTAALPVPESEREHYLMREIGARGMARHYGDSELAADLAYAGGQ